jgi:hypothetical protein
MAYLAFASWPLGEIERAISLIECMSTRIASLTHANTLALGMMHAAMFGIDARRPFARHRERLRTRSHRPRT